MSNENEPPIEHPTASELRLATGCYAVLFIPACFLATQAAYVFDGGDTPENQRVYWILVSFPITILISVAGARIFHKANKFSATIIMLLLPLIHLIWVILLN
ncbi:MAG TPA: hypothetical protein VN653_19710 [Anaerolineales bacterium]|nr:hypothetical protein [Anaerolineales bacterium]